MARSSLHRSPQGTLKRGLDENDERNLRIFFGVKSGKSLNQSGKENGLSSGAAFHVCRNVEENFENGFYKIFQLAVMYGNDFKQHLHIGVVVLGKDGHMHLHGFQYPYHLETTKTLESWIKGELMKCLDIE